MTDDFLSAVLFAQSEVAAQAQVSSQKLAEAERVRQAAVQEAAFYRAKVAALESGNPSDLSKVERERASELERHLTGVTSEHSSLQRQLAQHAESIALEKQLRLAAEDREAEAVRRATVAEGDHARTTEELHGLHEKHSGSESTVRELAEKLVSVGSLVSQHEVDRDTARSSLGEMQTSRDLHLRALEQAQSALGVAGTRSEEAEALYQREHERATQLELDINELRQELDTRSREADAATARLADVENAWARSREEADSLRRFTTGGLTEILDFHKDIQSNQDHSTRGHEEKTRAMDQESTSLRRMLHEAGTRVDESQSALGDYRKRTRQLEADQVASRSDIQAARASLAAALAETGRLREQVAHKEAEVRERSTAASELDVRLGMLRSLLADSGIAVNEDDLRNDEGGSSYRLRELEGKLAEKAHLHEEAERELDLSRRRVENAEAKAADLSRQLKGASIERSGSAAGGVISPSPDNVKALEAKLREKDKAMADAETASSSKLKEVEKDYQTAVHYVKATEKMIRRTKEELSKQKAVNESLQSELDGMRGHNSSEAGSRTRDANGRNTPSHDDPDLRHKLVDAQRQLSALSKVASDHQSLTAEHASLQTDYAQLREAYSQEMEDANDRIEHLQQEVDRLHQLSAGAQDIKRLQLDFADLKTENEDLQRKIRLLLDTQDYGDHLAGGGGGGGAANRNSTMSHFESEEDLNEEDLNQ